MADETPESKKPKLSKRYKVPIEIIPSIVQSTVDKSKSVSSNNKAQAQKAEDIKVRCYQFLNQVHENCLYPF